MLDSEGIAHYWQEQTKKGDNPCHYHNKWQDRYAFLMRTHAFKRKDFQGAKRIVDIGCGVGEYTREIAKLSDTDAHFDGFDFPFNIEIAQREYGDDPQVTYHAAAVPHESIRVAVRTADRVITTTVYVHFSEEARRAFYEYVSVMHTGSRVMLLEYMPDAIPEFQKGLRYKEVETPDEIAKKFEQVNFSMIEVRHVNYIDSFLFHHLGASALTFFITYSLERFLQFIGYSKSKYKLLIFEKN